jgi:bifunctional non-homologous end joining protein LigD
MPLPRITPVQLTLLKEPFDDPHLVVETKQDGFRAVLYVSDGNAKLVSRRGNVYKSFQSLQYEIAADLQVRDAIVDAEICVLDDSGRSLFYELMRRRQAPILYCFDLLYLNGRDLRQQPLIERKRQLQKLIKTAKKRCPSLLYA